MAGRVSGRGLSDVRGVEGSCRVRGAKRPRCAQRPRCAPLAHCLLFADREKERESHPESCLGMDGRTLVGLEAQCLGPLSQRPVRERLLP